MLKTQLQITSNFSINEIAKLNVINQIGNIKQYPKVQERLVSHKPLNIHGWFFHFEENLVYEWNHAEQDFKPINRISEKSEF